MTIGTAKAEITRNHVMSFGKHRNKSIETILDIDPGYIEWLVENGVMNIPDDIYQEAVENNFTGFEDDDAWFATEGWKD